MGTIRRAAVTGLFAAWLAPLSANADGRSTGDASSEDLPVERPAEAVAPPKFASPVREA